MLEFVCDYSFYFCCLLLILLRVLLYFSICLLFAFSVYILCMLFCVVGVVCFLFGICVLDIVMLLLCGVGEFWYCGVGGVGGVVCGVMLVCGGCVCLCVMFEFICVILYLLFGGMVTDSGGLGSRACVLVDVLKNSKYCIIFLVLFSLNTLLPLVLLRRGRE